MAASSAPWKEKFSTRGKLAAAVALYGDCRRQNTRRVEVPLLMLLGEKDDRVPPEGCLDLAASQPKDAAEIHVKIYPGAFHSFDRKRAPAWVAGHRLACDADATEDAKLEVRAFLHRYLD